MKMYTVEHVYDEGFDIPQSKNEIIAVFSTMEKAENFVAKYENAKAYDSTVTVSGDSDTLWCGLLVIKEFIVDKEPPIDDMWWLRDDDNE